MKRIWRGAEGAPERFRKRVERAFPPEPTCGARHLFWRLARAFERAQRRRGACSVRYPLGRNAKGRRSGFASYARWWGGERQRAADVLDGKERRDFKALWRGDDIGAEVKALLAAMTGGTCAWCEAQVRGAQDGDVEHVEPKSRFPTRAYDWGNYLLGCEICNRVKSDRWPRRGRLVRPDHDDPRRHLSFQEDGRVVGKTREGWRTIATLELNREHLVVARRTQIELVLRPLREAERQGFGGEMLRVLAEAAMPCAAVMFSAAVRESLGRMPSEA